MSSPSRTVALAGAALLAAAAAATAAASLTAQAADQLSGGTVRSAPQGPNKWTAPPTEG